MTSQPRLLVHVREYFWTIYQEMLSGVDAFAVEIVTDFAGHGVFAINPEFHRQMDVGRAPATGLDEAAIIRRCRLLRNLSHSQATAMVRAMHATLLPWVERHAWTAIVGQAVDDYITHLLSLMAEARGISYLGLCSSYFPGYTQVIRGWGGAYAIGRTVSETEAAAALARVAGPRFRQDYNILVRYDLSVHVVRVFRYWYKRMYFALLRQLKRAPYHIHYIMQPYLGQQKRLGHFPGANAFHLDWQKRLKQHAKPVVYLPLGHTPEAGTDYMIADTGFIDYEATIVRIAQTLSSDYVVMIKDHFHMLGVRDPAFYAVLRGMSGVILVPSTVNSNALLAESVHAVLVGAGSVGIEATVRGKAVYAFSDSIYWLEASRARFLPLEDLAEWPARIAAPEARVPEPVAFVRECLGTMLPYDYMILGENVASKGREFELFVQNFMEQSTLKPASP